MGRKLENKVNVEAPSAEFPFGRIKDDTLGLKNGTPVDEDVYGDFHQMMAKMVEAFEAEGFETMNGLPDGEYDGFQYYEALLTNARVANRGLQALLAETIIGSVAVVDPLVPHAIFGLFDDGSVVSPGFIYFAGKLFICTGLDYAPLSNALVYTIISENVIELTDDLPGSGDFDQSELKQVQAGAKQLTAIGTTVSLFASFYSVIYAGGSAHDLLGELNTGTGIFTPKRVGFYKVYINVNVEPLNIAVGTEFALSLLKNGGGAGRLSLIKPVDVLNTFHPMQGERTFEVTAIGDSYNLRLDASTSLNFTVRDVYVTFEYKGIA